METEKNTDEKKSATICYKKVGLMDENTVLGKCFKEYMDDRYRQMLRGGSQMMVPYLEHYVLDAFNMGYFRGPQVGEKIESKDRYLELKTRDYLQTVYSDSSIKFFYAVLAECCCEFVFEYGNIYKEEGSARTDGLIESINRVTWDGVERHVMYNNDGISNGRIIKIKKTKEDLEEGLEGNSEGANYCYYYEDLQDVFKLLGREAFKGYRLTRLLLPGKVNKLKKISFDYNYQCGVKEKNTVISDFYLERVIGLKELVILRTFLETQRLAGKGVDQEPIIKSIKIISGLKEELRNNPFIYLGILPNVLSIAESIYGTRLEAVKGLANVISIENNEICKEVTRIAEYSLRMKQYIMDFIDIEKYLISVFEGYYSQVNNSGIHLAEKLEKASKTLGAYIKELQSEKKEELQKVQEDVALVMRLMYREIDSLEKNSPLDSNSFLVRLISSVETEDIVIEKVKKVLSWEEADSDSIYEEVMKEFGELAKAIHSCEIDGTDIGKRVKEILGRQIKTECHKGISLKSEINNQRIHLIKEYLDANRFFDLNENYLSAEKVLNDTPALNWYNGIHKKNTAEDNKEETATC